MKVKRSLFITSGIIKCVVGAMLIGLFGLLLLLKNVFKSALVADSNGLVQLIQELVNIDDKYTYLLDSSYDQMAEFLLSVINIFAIVMIVMGIIGIVLGVFNFIFARKYNEMLQNKLHKKIIFTVISFVFYWEIVSNILTTVALFTKDDKVQSTIIIN